MTTPLLFKNGELPAKAELPDGMRWHAFVSHAQSTGGDQAQCLALALEADMAWAVWYDQNADVVTVSGMREGVELSAVFILFLSKGALSRPFVQFEIRTAFLAEKPFFLLQEEGALHVLVILHKIEAKRPKVARMHRPAPQSV